MHEILDRLRGGLVVSCQPVDGGPMDRPDIVAAMAQAAVNGGAAGLRIEGIDNLRAVRPKVDVPIIGIVKSDGGEAQARITVTTGNVGALINAGADIVAYDATDRPRHSTRDDILKTILAGGAVAMADCSTIGDAHAALAGGAFILGTTLAGYTAATASEYEGPDLALVHEFHVLGGFVMAEGRYISPALVTKAMQAGADSVTVGSALTRLEHVTGWFVAAINKESQ